MNTRLLIIAHAPLAHALRECALHVFSYCADDLLALDVPPDEPPEQTLSKARALLGWAPQVSVEEGLRRTVDFIRENPHLYRPEEYAV